MSDTRTARILIVGAGQAGLQTAQALRKRGHTGLIVLAGEEPYPPYQRPPLSKAFLKGEADETRLELKGVDFYTDQAIDLRLGVRIVSLDPDRGIAEAESGERFEFDVAVIATGSTPRRLPFADISRPGVMELRGIDDAKRMRQAFASARSVAVVGGGYIGLEAASVARGLGLRTHVLEREPRLLSRVAGPLIGDYFQTLHERNGVEVALGASVTGLAPLEGPVAAVETADGRVDADVVLIGVGVAPCIELAERAGVACADGVVVDGACRTSQPAVFAVGDCARRRIEAYDAAVRLESVHNALDQGDRAAAGILGDPPPPYDPPWFWSDQYAVKLQTVGLSQGANEEVLRGAPASDSFSVFYYRSGALIAVDAVNDPASYLVGKRVLKDGRTIAPADAGNLDFDLKTAMR
ncbi:MAG: FAD-dependent oxidoreductase [Pseudomonadota bacterium]